MYGIFSYIYHKIQPNLAKYIVHGWYGIVNFALIQNPSPSVCCPRIASQKLVTIVALPSPSAETTQLVEIRVARKVGATEGTTCESLIFWRDLQRSSYWLEVSWGLVGRKLVPLLMPVVAWPCQMLTMRASSPCCTAMIFIAEVVVFCLFCVCSFRPY